MPAGGPTQHHTGSCPGSRPRIACFTGTRIYTTAGTAIPSYSDVVVSTCCRKLWYSNRTGDSQPTRETISPHFDVVHIKFLMIDRNHSYDFISPKWGNECQLLHPHHLRNDPPCSFPASNSRNTSSPADHHLSTFPKFHALTDEHTAMSSPTSPERLVSFPKPRPVCGFLCSAPPTERGEPWSRDRQASL